MAIAISQSRIDQHALLSVEMGWTIARLAYHEVNGLYWPFMKTTTPELGQWIVMFDEKVFQLSPGWVCTECCRSIPQDSWQRRCVACEDLPRTLRFRCIYTSAGEPFAKSCTPKEPYPCGDTQHAQWYCLREYVLYIGCIGPKLKIGICALNRGGAKTGYIHRLVEQGLDFAVVLRHPKKMSLAEAQMLEAEISEEFGLSQKLTFNEKVEALFSNNAAIATVLEIIQAILQRYPPLQILAHCDLREKTITSPDISHKGLLNLLDQARILRFPLQLVGRIVFTQGELAIMESDDEYFMLNLRDLVGRVMVDSEEGF
ncbi:MAG: hypothetical protein ACE5OZ_02370 [Candidatus Heimdallarchaeota archaeon]